MIKVQKRNIVKCVLLSIITFGIYGIVWVIKMMQEAVSLADPNDNATLEIILAILFSPVGYFLAERKLADGCARMGIKHQDRSIVYLVLGLLGFGWVNAILMQGDLNYIAEPEGAMPQM